MNKINLDSDLIWIKNWTRENKTKNCNVVFRKSFTLSTIPHKADTYIAVDTKYWLYINSELVIFEGGLFRESMPNSGYADKVDIAPYLKSGKNTIAIHVLYYGNEGRNNIDSGTGGLIFQCNTLNIKSDSSFKYIKHPAYYNTAAPNPSYLYGGDNCGFNANFDIEGIYTNEFDDSQFEYAATYDSKQFGDIYERPIPQIKYGNLIKSNYDSNRDNKFFITLPYAMQIQPCFNIIAEKNTIIDIRTDRYAVNGGPGDQMHTYNGHRIEYICKDKENVFESSRYLFGEKIIISSNSPIKITWLGYRESGYDTEIVGKYECSCEIMNTLIKKAARTLYVCMRDNFMDCPDRERGQWIGDVSVQAPQVFFMMNSSAKLLLKKSIYDFINLRKGNVLVGNVPGANFSELPAQSLNAISEIGLISNYYKYTGDKEVLHKAYEPCIKYLALWDIGENGLVVHRQGNWAWFDHLHNIDQTILENAWYYSALKFAKYMSDILIDNRYDYFLDSRLTSINNNFNKHFWNGNYYTSGTVVDDRANAMAVLSGLCESTKYSKIRNILLTVFNASIYMENYVLSALCEMGFHNDAYHRLVSRYYNLAKNENSTLWEDFYLLGTKNHAWSGAPINIAFKYFLGINTNDGFKTYTINPAKGIFDFQKAELITPQGILKINSVNNETTINVQ